MIASTASMFSRGAEEAIAWSQLGEALGPFGRARQRGQTTFMDQPAIELLLGVGDPLDALGGGAGDPLRDNRVVAQAEGFEELIVRERHAFGSHAVAPGEPVVLFRIDQGAVEIPQNRAGGRHQNQNTVAARSNANGRQA